MNVFDAVKDELNARRVVEAYGIHVLHNGMCCCPFHGDKNSSMKVDDKRFHCFGCGEDGDVIQFVARYFDLSRYEAAKKLAEDFSVSYDQWKPDRDEKGKPVKPKPRPKSPEQFYREKEQHFFKEISDHYHRLQEWKENFKPQTMDEEWDDHFVEALNYIPMMEQIMYEFLAGDRSVREALFQAHSKLEGFCEKRNLEAKAQKSVSERFQSTVAPSQRNDTHQKTVRTQDAIAI